MENIGLIGVGIVGNAFLQGMNHKYKVLSYDKYKPADFKSVKELSDSVEIIFICLPTPMNADGSCDLNLIESNIQEISNNNIVVIKSTVPPGTNEYLKNKYPHLKFVFNPEFLTENNPVEDFKKQDRIIIGGDAEAVEKVAVLYRNTYPDVPIIKTDATTAELSKYVVNCFLATKVSFANEIYQIAEKLGVNYNLLVNISNLDKRLGSSHWRVPGPMLVNDKPLFGFGGKCFPKDLNALIATAKKLGVDPKVLMAVWEKNLEVRDLKDWESIPWATFKCGYGQEINIDDKTKE